MTEKMCLLFYSNADRAALWQKRLAELEPAIELRVWPDGAGNLAEIDAALVWKPPAGMLAKLPNLKAVLSLGMGVDHVFADPLLPKHVPVARLVDPELVERMSEYCALAVLRYHRNTDRYEADQRARRWDAVWEPHASGRRVGIMGLGEIGRDVAAKLKIFGFQLAGWSRTKKSIDSVTAFHGADGFVPFLQRSEYLICVLPLTPATDGILDARAFAALPRGAYVINAGRGGHVVDADLLAALDKGHLAGAQLDVFRQEPPPADHAYWAHPKVRITPHNAGLTNPATAARQIVDNLRRAVRGEPLANRVLPERGY